MPQGHLRGAATYYYNYNNNYDYNDPAPHPLPLQHWLLLRRLLGHHTVPGPGDRDEGETSKRS